MAPFFVNTDLPLYFMYAVYLLIGVGFGAALEMAGFGHSPRLAAQFYFKDMTVLKVMFTAIITAMVLIFLTSALGFLDFDKVWVNPTYLWPGILGGFIMGIGFIIGGFCPGTSIVAVATLKVDGLFFALGSLFGILMFGEMVSLFEGFWNSSFYGRLTLPDVFGLPTGIVVVLVIFMALFMFWGGEQLERIIGKRDLSKDPKQRYAGAAVFVVVALAVAFIGQPTLEDKWDQVKAENQPLLENREVQIHPGELLELMYDDGRNLVMLDVRDQRDYNLFHIKDAKRVEMDELEVVREALLDAPTNTVVVLISNDENQATTAWKHLKAMNQPNVYLLSGGINHWLDVFGHEGHEEETAENIVSDTLRHYFKSALGAEHYSSEPPEEALHHIDYERKVKIIKVVRRQGGCG